MTFKKISTKNSSWFQRKFIEEYFFIFRQIEQIKEENQLLRKQFADEQAKHLLRRASQGKRHSLFIHHSSL